VLAEEGFRWDSSQHDSVAVRGRIAPAARAPHALPDGVWEFPVAVWSTRRGRLPVGGASYWAVTPTPVVLRGLERAGEFPGLYLHPYELDPLVLRAGLPGSASASQRAHAGLRSLQRNAARRRAPRVLRAIAGRFRLIPYGEAYARLNSGAAARS
jgi:hypothetical protein